MKRCRHVFLLVLPIGMAAVANAGEEKGVPPAFERKPAVRVEGDGVRIEFAADRVTNVAVDILDAGGKVVRHLAAGMLGPHAPEPLARDTLRQSLLWDRKDDDGKPVAGPCSVRVGLGLGVKYAGEYGGGYQPIEGLPWDGRNIDNLKAVACGPDGTVYMRGGFFHGHIDRHPHLIALDKDGNYLREIYPPPARLLPDKVPGMATLRLADGSVIPQVGSWWDLFIPEMTATRQMVVTPDGFLLLATEAPDHVTERRALLKIGADGSIPRDAWSLKLPPGMHTQGFSMAASLDGKALYVSGLATTRPSRPLHAVYRLELDGSNNFARIFGEEGVAGDDDRHLKDPAGVAVGKGGTIFVADYGNNRLVAIRRDGTFAGQARVDRPFAVAADPRSGAVYVLSASIGPANAGSPVIVGRLTRFSAEFKEAGSADAAVKVDFGYGKIPARFGGMGIGLAGDKPVIWIGCTSEPDGCNGYPYGYGFGVVKVTDEGEGLSRPVFVDMSAAVFEARRKKHASSSALQRDGYSYHYIMKSSGDPSVIWLTRKDAKGQDAPFPAAGDKKWAATLGRPSARYYGEARVNYQNDILFRYYNWLGNDEKRKYGATTIDQFAPDGSVRKRELVYGMHEGCFATPFLVDRKGNIYVSDHIQPPGRVAPEEIEAAFAANGSKPGRTYVETYGSIFKFPPTGGGFRWGEGTAAGPVKGDLIRKPTAVEDNAWNKVNRAVCEGAEWQFFGIAPVAATRGTCMCTGATPALDGHARVYVPDAYRMCVHVLDTNGNYLLRIGKYGNQDDAKGAIAFARPRFVSVAAPGRIIVTDPQNGKATRIDLVYAAEATVTIP
ncbi:MAG: hypothetical protein N3A38_01950 [Planctomycetota bacterium]|nr:hypothetical protein [Planctomycetota bacterium]